MGRQDQAKASADLLNFHFSAPAPQSQPNSNTRNRNNRNNSRGGRGGNKNSQQYRRSKEDRASSRRKASAQNFYLHSSPDHAFILSRIPGKHQQYSFNGPDSAVSWESVRMVKYLSSQEEHCPICLDEMICPRITKCGHSFCLSCVIHHVQAHTANNPYTGPKCPCCAIPLHLEDLRPVSVQSISASAVHFVKLHRVKNCPAPFLPLFTTPRRSSPRAAPCQIDPDAPYSKFNYVDPPTYQAHLQFNLHELQRHAGDCNDNGIEAVCLSLALERVQGELQTALNETEQESELMERFASSAAGMYQPHPEPLLCPQRTRGESIGSEASCSVDSATTGGSPRGSRKKRVIEASMFLDEGETAFYQADDGSLCFLSGFNMNCLRTEFSPGLPGAVEEGSLTAATPRHYHKSMPLPDRVDGRVVQVEKVNLTPELRSRYRFLSHLPVYSDITFVELSLGALLSAETKKAFKKEFQKRKQAREKMLKQEARADAQAQRKEQARIDALKARIQSIDPEDQFFHASSFEEEITDLAAEDFGPSLGGPAAALAAAQSEFSFSQITREGGAFPSLASSPTEFPSLGGPTPPVKTSLSSSPPAKPSWGPPPKKAVQLAPPPKGKKKGKGKKVLLFSTGSHRGTVS